MKFGGLELNLVWFNLKPFEKWEDALITPGQIWPAQRYWPSHTGRQPTNTEEQGPWRTGGDADGFPASWRRGVARNPVRDDKVQGESVLVIGAWRSSPVMGAPRRRSLTDGEWRWGTGEEVAGAVGRVGEEPWARVVLGVVSAGQDNHRSWLKIEDSQRRMKNLV
jgi:hypothetical protein